MRIRSHRNFCSSEIDTSARMSMHTHIYVRCARNLNHSTVNTNNFEMFVCVRIAYVCVGCGCCIYYSVFFIHHVSKAQKQKNYFFSNETQKHAEFRLVYV